VWVRDHRSGFRVWLYLADDTERLEQGCVHLIGQAEGVALDAYLGDRLDSDPSTTGALDHIAFFATDWPACRDRLTRFRVTFTERFAPALNVRQVFVTDPDGVTIELNFPSKP
jgi:catechol 2,3-dioxygenase-like lactoylglutathione lyase family enzyme